MSNGPLGSGFMSVGVPPIEDIRRLTRNPADNAGINAAIEQSVQEFPPAINTGAFFAQLMRGRYLPPYGTKDRDRVLRLSYRDENNSLIQGTVSALIKKLVTTPWEIKTVEEGADKGKIYLPNAQGQMKSIAAIEHYQMVLQNAQFGAGWEVFLSRYLEDFFTQDFGAVTELIGPGEPVGPITGPVTGIAQLDAGRCFITGNPYYPIMYFSLISGSLHRMHADRIVRFVDSPSPDERYFGIGLCAMSRAIAIYVRQRSMQQYIEGRVDDKPAPGILTIQGITTKQREVAFSAYAQRQEVPDERPFWGKNIILESVNVDQPIKIESIPFSVTPEKFDWKIYNDIDVDSVALAFNMDRQEIWELAGKGLGSGAQSQVLAEKARGKMFGFLLQNCERWINRRVLPKQFEFSFDFKEQSEETAKAQQNYQHAQTINLLVTAGVMSAQQGQRYLADASQDFKNALTNEAGQIEAPDAAQRTDPNVSLEDDNPIDVSQQQDAPQPSPLQQKSKAFGLTASDFAARFSSLAILAVNNRIDRNEFEGTLLDLLSTAGAAAFADGLRAGGVVDMPDPDEEAIIEDWLVNQIDFIDGLAAEVFDGKLQEDAIRTRAEMWVNKSLREVFNSARLSADSNSMYEWQLGMTETHCEDCQRLNGQRHRLKQWAVRGLTPPTERTQCHGYHCDCHLVRTDQPAIGRF